MRRERTNTPLQALVTLNDPQFVEAARRWRNRRWSKAAETADHRIDFIARRLLARPFRPEELAVVQTSLAKLSAFYQSHSRAKRSCSPSASRRPTRRSSQRPWPPGPCWPTN